MVLIKESFLNPERIKLIAITMPILYKRLYK